MSKKKLLPKFESEAEEARWYFEHRHELQDYFEEAPEGDPELDAILAKSPRRAGRPPSDDPSRHVQLRMPVRVVERVKGLAAAQGLPYQKLLKTWIFKALEEEEGRKAGSQ